MKTYLLAIFALALASFACTISSAQFSTLPKNTPAAQKSTARNATETQAGIIYATVTATDYLNVRSGPSHLSPLVRHVFLVHGEQVIIYECRAGWARISKANEAPRWVNSVYLSKSCE
jgi:uncharacterized protein YgiM (DUF1202 family)